MSSSRTTTANGPLEGAFAWLASHRDAALIFSLIGIVGLMVVPLPPLILDLLLTVNISIAVLVMLTSVYVDRPLDFSVFPALLLITTLFRLGLNVASTRLILLGAADGQVTVGKIIETFGRFVVGGNSVIGIIVFLILVVINFMVITKGAGRIAEVTARFTLDAMPGKQMSIDAELAAGAITDAEARTRRREVERESDFYGAMDGASKFVRGDAIAGLIITAINIIGGLLIAVGQGGMPIGTAAETYTVLTVGDGLVSQIPALLISTGAGLIVTRAAGANDFGDELSGQLLSNPTALYGASGALIVLGLVPGMPFFVCLFIGLCIALVAWRVRRAAPDADAASDADADDPPASDVPVDELLKVESLTLEIGFGLVSLVETKGGLLERLVQMRRQFADELGIIVPAIHIRDNLSLTSGGYRLLLKGTPVGGGELVTGNLLAIDPGTVATPVAGRPTKDPTFGLDALWIAPSDRLGAEGAGYTVVDLDGVVTTHVSELIRVNGSELFGWQELQQRLDIVKRDAPKLVDELIPNLVSFGTVLSVLRRLLQERISIRDLHTILEAIAEYASTSKAVSALVGHVRSRLAAQISALFSNERGVLYATLLDRGLEKRLRQCLVSQEGEPVLACDLATAQGLFAEIETVLGNFAVRDAEPVILAPPDLRGPLHHFLTQFFPNLHVICHREVSARTQIQSVGQLRLRDNEGELASEAA